MGNGPCLLGASVIAGFSVLRLRPWSHTRSPSLYLGIVRCLIQRACALVMASWALFLAILRCSRRVEDCGRALTTSFQSARGWYPIRRRNGDSLVVSLLQLLWVNSAIGR